MAEKKNTAVRREEIIAAALAIVERDGLAGLNMADIAAAVHLVPSALYRHFAGKDAIVAALIDFIGRSLLDNAHRVRQAAQDVPAQLRLLFHWHWRLARERRGVPQLFFSLLVERENAALHQQMLTAVTPYVEQVGRIIEQGQREGQIRPDVAPLSATLLLIGMVQHLALMSAMGMPLTADHEEQIWRIYWHGVCRVRSEEGKVESGKW